MVEPSVWMKLAMVEVAEQSASRPGWWPRLCSRGGCGGRWPRRPARRSRATGSAGRGLPAPGAGPGFGPGGPVPPPGEVHSASGSEPTSPPQHSARHLPGGQEGAMPGLSRAAARSQAPAGPAGSAAPVVRAEAWARVSSLTRTAAMCGAAPCRSRQAVESGFSKRRPGRISRSPRSSLRTISAGRAERLRRGPHDLIRHHVPARPRQQARGVQGQAERQVTLVPPPLLAFLRCLRIGPVGDLLREFLNGPHQQGSVDRTVPAATRPPVISRRCGPGRELSGLRGLLRAPLRSPRAVATTAAARPAPGASGPQNADADLCPASARRRSHPGSRSGGTAVLVPG